MITLILLIISAIFKALMDLSSEDKFSIKWFNKNQSWQNKYKYKPKWLFTTILVFITDGWHLFQFFFLNTLFLSIVLYSELTYWYLDFIIYRVLYGVVFELTYRLKK